MDGSNLMRPKQTAELLNVTERTLRQWRQRGWGPAFLRLPGGIRYERPAVVQWLESCKVHRTTESV